MPKQKKLEVIKWKARKKKEILIIFFIASITLTLIIYYNYEQMQPEILDNLPRVYITCQHRIRRYAYRDCVVDIDFDSTIAEIKYRGVYNYYFPKKEYRMQLYEQKSFLGMRTDDDWILFAMHFDYPHMRIKLSFDMWRSLEDTDPTAILPESSYVNLFINGEYHGIYLLSETEDRKLFNLDPPQNNIDSSLIFKVNYNTDFKSYNSSRAEWQQVLPDIEEINLMEKILPELTGFVNNTSDEDFFDPETGIYTKFDKLNLIDFLIFNYFIIHIDFWDRNYLLVKNSNPSKFYFIPWDFDASFGQWGDLLYDPDLDLEALIRWKHGLYDRLMGNEEFMKCCKERWFELRKELWTEEFILDMLIENYEEIKDSLELSIKVWEEEDNEIGKENDVEKYIDYLFEWIPERLDFCDFYFSKF